VSPLSHCVLTQTVLTRWSLTCGARRCQRSGGGRGGSCFRESSANGAFRNPGVTRLSRTWVRRSETDSPGGITEKLHWRKYTPRPVIAARTLCAPTRGCCEARVDDVAGCMPVRWWHDDPQTIGGSLTQSMDERRFNVRHHSALLFSVYRSYGAQLFRRPAFRSFLPGLFGLGHSGHWRLTSWAGGAFFPGAYKNLRPAAQTPFSPRARTESPPPIT